MKLVIVESPGKIAKIQNILGSDYIVLATKGHLIDLHPKKMSVDIKNNFEPEYVPIKGKESVISQIQKTYAKSRDIFIATDKDREGEMIGWSIAHILKIENPKRIVFNSITKTDICNAVKNPSLINNKMVESQKCRRILDRLVGFSISPLLWDSGLTGRTNCLSAGRVQSVVVRLIIDRENEISEFFKSDKGSYFKISGDFTYGTISLNASIKERLTEGKADSLMKLLKDAKFKIADIKIGKKTKSPSAPFTTSTLQQDAGKKFGFTVKRTMDSAQRLYEAGHITYMRTDSIILSREALDECASYIEGKFGKEYLNIHQYKQKGGNVQEAHEAIRPTHIDIDSITSINNDDVKLYNLIWCHTIASQMSSAIYKTFNTSISISNTEEYKFTSDIELLEFDGYLRVYSMSKNEKMNDPDIKIGIELEYKSIIAEQHYNKPDGRYNETSLVNILDPKNLNIGRPSTYASIINKIKEVGYIEIKDIDGIEKESVIMELVNGEIKRKNKIIYLGKETNKMVPSQLAIEVNNFLMKNFVSIMDYKFTSDMENKLDEIVSGEEIWYKILDEFYRKLKPNIDTLLLERKDKRVVGLHPSYNTEIVAQYGRYGPYISVTNGDTIMKAPIKAPLTIESIKIEDVVKLFEYPKKIGEYQDINIYLQKGKFGIYLLYNKQKIGIKNIDEEAITLEKAIELIDEKKDKIARTITIGRTKYNIIKGPYGLYISYKNKNIKFPDKYNIETATITEIKAIIDNYKPKKFRKFRKINPK